MQLQLLPATTAETFDRAKTLLVDIERADGMAAVSDQAWIATTEGTRSLFLIISRPIADEPLNDAIQNAIGVGIIGEGELDLALLDSHRTHENEASALRLLIERGDGELRSWIHGDRPQTSAALAAAGFSPVRSLYRMALDVSLLPADDVSPFELAAPAGMHLRAFAPDGSQAAVAADAAAWVSANAAAFATHPEQGRITVSDFAKMRREPWFDATDLLLLDAGDELAGSTWIKTLREADAVSCELYAVGVRPKYAGRGLGKFLLHATLARMAEHRPDHVTLYVDGDNTPAVGLYERAGFTIDSRSYQWLKPDLASPSVRMDP